MPQVDNGIGGPVAKNISDNDDVEILVLSNYLKNN